MSNSILDLEPKRFWYHFNEICKIPHESGNETALCEYLKGFAKELGFEAVSDSVGNLVIKKPAQNSSSTKAVVLQGHMDMVCEKVPASKHDFAKDPIKPMIEDGWVTAQETSLGADDGVAIAASMAIMEAKDLKHGPLEFLFTISEETGLDGAKGLDAFLIDGRIMLNLDSEEDGILFVGCAGATDFEVKVPFNKVSVPEKSSGFEIKISDLLGGHSGLVIHFQRANAIKLLSRIFSELSKNVDVLISSIDGGTRHNVIPYEATARFVVNSEDAEKAESLAMKIGESLKKEYDAADPGLKFEISNTKITEAMDEDASLRLIRCIDLSPHGVIKMSHDLEGLVQTSTNLAKIVTEDGFVSISHSSRSSNKTELEALSNSIHSLAKLSGAEFEETGGYPGWQPNMDSELLAFTKRVYQKLYNDEPGVTAIHAGLECGLIGEKLSGMDMISFGPHLESVHSPNERVKIDTCEKFYNLITNLLEELAV